MSMKIHKDKVINIIEIIWGYDLVYVIKFGIVVFMCHTVRISNNISQASSKDVLPMLTFAISLFIDCIVAGKFVKNNLKGFLLVHTVLSVVVFSGLIYIFTIYTQQIVMNDFSVDICNLYSMFCCISPVMELIYDINSHLQNEENNNYN